MLFWYSNDFFQWHLLNALDGYPESQCQEDLACCKDILTENTVPLPLLALRNLSPLKASSSPTGAAACPRSPLPSHSSSHFSQCWGVSFSNTSGRVWKMHMKFVFLVLQYLRKRWHTLRIGMSWCNVLWTGSLIALEPGMSVSTKSNKSEFGSSWACTMCTGLNLTVLSLLIGKALSKRNSKFKASANRRRFIIMIRTNALWIFLWLISNFHLFNQRHFLLFNSFHWNENFRIMWILFLWLARINSR